MDPFDPVESLADMRHEFGEHGGVNMSVEVSTTFSVMHAETMPEIFQGRQGVASGCYLYGRHFNPTTYVLGRQIAALEGAEAGYCTASGMAAITAVVLQLCNNGEHLVASRNIYGGTHAFFKDYMPLKTGIGVSFVDPTDLDAVEAAFCDNTRLLYVETLSNPTLRVANLPRLAEIAHRRGALLVVDNTFSPLVLSPIRHGADVVVHSLTKFMNGASDIVGGAICGPLSFMQELMDLHTGSLMLLGPTMDPRQAFSISMRLPHLALRMREHGRRARIIAERLDRLGLEVIYPGLERHADHVLLAELANPGYGFGGMVGLDVLDQRRAFELMELLQNKDRFGIMAVSLGYYDTLLSCPSASTSSEMTPDEQRAAGIRPGLLRLSIGYTGSLEQRWAQLRDALEIMNLVPLS